MVCFPPKKIMILLVYQCENRTANRHPRFTLVARFFPGFFVQPDLFGLLYMKWFITFIKLKCRALKMHSQFCSPHCSSIGSSTPPDAFPQSLRMWFQAQQAWWVWK